MIKNRFMLISSILLLALSSLPAAVTRTNLSDAIEESLMVNAVIPEDYGIEFPEAFHMDRLYFSYTQEADALISSDHMDAGLMQVGENEFRISLLYYGNQSKDYTFILEADADEGWRDDMGNVIPLDMKVVDATDTDDISVTERDRGSAEITIPAAGPRRGDAAVDIILEWLGSPDPEPGTYTADVNLRMYSV